MSAQAIPMFISVPAGWSAERFVLCDPSGAIRLAVTIEAAAAPDGAALAASRADATATAFPGYREEALRTVEGVTVRRFSWATEDGPRVTNAHLYLVSGARAVVGSLGSQAELTPDAEDVAARILAGLQVREDPRVRSFGYTTAELTALAEILGQRAFPGTGDHRFATAEERSHARRALLARGTVRSDTSGRLAIEPAQQAVLTTALSPQRAFSVEHRRGKQDESRLFHVNRTMSVAQVLTADGVHWLTAFPTRELRARVLGFVQLRERAVAGQERFTVPADVYERLGPAAATGKLGSIESSSRLRLLRRSNGKITGGEIAWVDAGEAGNWLVEPGTGEVGVVPASAGAIAERIGSL